MRPLGILLILLSAVFPALCFVELLPKYDAEALFSQYLGSVALILMSISQLMATRFPGVQFIFGGLDRVYLLHKWIGIIAISALMLHDTIDAEMKNLGRETWLADMAEESGEIALYGLLILGIISLITVIPYGWWKKTHKFIGVFFAMSAFHYLYILKPFSLLDPLGLYISAFCILGVFCYLYMLVMHGIVDRPFAYTVTNITHHGGTAELDLSPVGRGLKHKAGQFAFLNIGGEKHPFTIACGPNDNRDLKFCIKAMGDFTKAIGTTLKVREQVHVSRPFGRFIPPKAKTQCWIAGGIGITPFLAWLDTLKPEQGVAVHLFYCIRSANEKVPFAERLKHPRVTLHIIDSAKGQRLDIEHIKETLGPNLRKVKFSFCGPKAMRQMLQTDIMLSYEEFEMRSSTPLNFIVKLMKLVLNKSLAHKQP